MENKYTYYYHVLLDDQWKQNHFSVYAPTPEQARTQANHILTTLQQQYRYIKIFGWGPPQDIAM